MKRRPAGNSNGTTLVLNLIVLVFFSMIAVIVYSGAKAMVGEAMYNARSAQALASAEAGLDDALHSLYQNPSWRTGFVNKPFAGGSYTVTLTLANPPVVASTGYSAPLLLKGPAVRTITVLADYALGACPYAVMGEKPIQVDGKVDGYDPLVSLTPSATSFITGGSVRSNAGVAVGGAACPPAHIFGDVITLGAGPPSSCVTGAVNITTQTMSVPLYDCPSCETVNDNLTGIAPSSAYNAGGKKLKVDAAHPVVTLSSGTYFFFQMQVDKTLNVDTSSGPVSIYLKNNFSSSAGCQINNLSKIPSRFHIYGTTPGNIITLNCATPLHAYFEGSQAKFFLQQELYGHFCTVDVAISSAAKVHYDLGGGVISHVAWTTGLAGSWTESYKRQ